MTAQRDSIGAKPDVRFEWEVHPVRERPLQGAVVSLIVLTMGWYVQIESGLWLAGAGAVLILVLVLQRFFFVSRYVLDAEAVAEQGVWGCRRVRWDAVQLVAVGTRAAWLSELPRRSWRENKRGVHLLFGRHRGKILAALRQHLPERHRGALSETATVPND